MFDHSILSLPSKEEKRAAIHAALIDANDKGTLTYTDIMLNDQNLATFAFELMDGVQTDSNNVPQYNQGDRIDLGPVRLVAIDPAYVIKLNRWKYDRIPGTALKPRNRVKRAVAFGNDATIDDRYDEERPVRRILWDHGWPIKQFRSQSGGEVGQIVEWKWFERVALSADATDEYRELYATLKARIEQQRPSTTNDTKTKAPAAGRVQEQRP